MAWPRSALTAAHFLVIKHLVFARGPQSCSSHWMSLFTTMPHEGSGYVACHLYWPCPTWSTQLLLPLLQPVIMRPLAGHCYNQSCYSNCSHGPACHGCYCYCHCSRFSSLYHTARFQSGGPPPGPKGTNVSTHHYISTHQFDHKLADKRLDQSRYPEWYNLHKTPLLKLLR